MGLDKLLAKIKQYNPQVDEKFIEETYRFAEKAHEGQTRISGEPYIIHPLSVAHILADLELDVVTIAAGLLHDVVEDTDSPLETIEEKFGVEIALLVDGVTKLSRISYKTRWNSRLKTCAKCFWQWLKTFGLY